MNVYAAKYPHHLPWSSRLWVLKVGDVLTYQGKRYQIKQAIRSPVPGVLPSYDLEEVQPPTP